MRHVFITAALCMLILLTGCTEKNNEEQQRGKTNLEYEYIAESSEYVYKITPDTLEIQYKEKLSSPIVINPEINKITYAEVDAAEFDICLLDTSRCV